MNSVVISDYEQGHFTCLTPEFFFRDLVKRRTPLKPLQRLCLRIFKDFFKRGLRGIFKRFQAFLGSLGFLRRF